MIVFHHLTGGLLDTLFTSMCLFIQREIHKERILVLFQPHNGCFSVTQPHQIRITLL